MKKAFSLLKTIYYYLQSSYKMWRVRQLQEDDLVYTTIANDRNKFISPPHPNPLPRRGEGALIVTPPLMGGARGG